MRTPIVRCEQPFHSFRMIPHTLENVTFNAMRIQNERVISVGDSVRNPCPNDRPKNCEYHNPPANAQNSKLFVHTLPFA